MPQLTYWWCTYVCSAGLAGDATAAYQLLCTNCRDTCWINKQPVVDAHGRRCHLMSQEGYPLVQGCGQKVSQVCRWKC
jgi:hypothetical protein